jgi:glucose/arabinose dehydrogenase
MRRFALVLCTVAVLGVAGPTPAEVPGAPTEVPQVLLAPVPGVFQQPVAMAQHPDSDDLYVVEKTGRIRAVREGLVFDPVPVLDLSAEVSGGLEQGLLGLAFSPDGDHLYVNFTDNDGGSTHVVEFAFDDGAVVPDSRRELLFVEQPFANHNAGTLMFGPDGYLYIALGDGGGGGDPHYHSQSVDTLLGNMLRIDPTPSDDAPYTVPPDNPFVPDPDDEDKVVPEDAREEIWAYGLRNPWKFSFDRDTGDLWIADVGQNRWEEINLQRADSPGGENYGWNHMEGLEPYTGRPAGAEEPDDHAPPIHVYPISGEVACAVTGGYVYRGDAIPWLQGAYVYSDWCDSRLLYIREEDGEVVEEGELGVTVPSIVSFGEDHDGELYAVSLGGTVFKLLPGLP